MGRDAVVGENAAQVNQKANSYDTERKQHSIFFITVRIFVVRRIWMCGLVSWRLWDLQNILDGLLLSCAVDNDK